MRRRGKLVGTGRFELPTPRTPSECSTRLSHVPTTAEVCFPSLSPARSPAWPQMEANFWSCGWMARGWRKSGSNTAPFRLRSSSAPVWLRLGQGPPVDAILLRRRQAEEIAKTPRPCRNRAAASRESATGATAGNNCAAGSLSERCALAMVRMFSGAEHGFRARGRAPFNRKCI